MSQQPQHRQSDPRTLHGLGPVWSTGRGRLVTKLFPWAAGLPEQAVRDFTQQAARVANLRHPQVARVVEVGTLGDGTPFVSLERIGGMVSEEAAGDRPLLAFIDTLERAFVNAARPRSNAPASPVASPSSSLTQQFFAEGEQLETAHAVAHATGELETATARLPRSRAQMILVVLLAVGSVAVIAWTVISLASKPEGGSPATPPFAPPAAVARPATLSSPRPQSATRVMDRDPRRPVADHASRARPQPRAGALPTTTPPAFRTTGTPNSPPPPPAAAAPLEVPAPIPPPTPAPLPALRAPEPAVPAPESTDGIPPPRARAASEPREAAPSAPADDVSAPASAPAAPAPPDSKPPASPDPE